jgi:PAP2 superfamily
MVSAEPLKQDMQTSVTGISLREHVWHFSVTAILALGLYPAFRLARLPFSIDLIGMASAYWVGTGLRAMFLAIVLYVACMPYHETLKPLLHRYSAEKVRWIAVAIFAIWMFVLFGFSLGTVVVVDGIALAELFERRKQAFGAALADIALPASYLFCGLILIFSWQHVVAGLRYAGEYDDLFNRADSLLFHANVASISHAAIARFPLWVFRAAELVYYSLYAQVGAAIAITALASGRKRALGYVTTLVIAYYLALAAFSIWPTMGPFSICQQHSSTYPHELPTYWSQKAILAKAKLIRDHNLLVPEVRTVNAADYYIGFPCMHIGLPLIALWFLRKWKRIALVLVCVDVLLLISIILLEWHYVIDVPGGVAVAALAIWIGDRLS